MHSITITQHWLNYHFPVWACPFALQELPVLSTLPWKTSRILVSLGVICISHHNRCLARAISTENVNGHVFHMDFVPSKNTYLLHFTWRPSILQPSFRDRWGHQNGWIFGKVPNGLWPPFWKIMLRISRQNCDKSAYVHYGGTVVYYMILFPMRCM